MQHYPGSLRSILNELYEDLDILEHRQKYQMLKVRQDTIRSTLMRDYFLKT